MPIAFGQDLRIEAIPQSLRESHSIGTHYQKLCKGDVPVIGSAKVSDHALAEAAWVINHMLTGRDDIKKAMNESKVRVAIMAATEYTTDIPEHSFLKTKMFWDRRARGLGATAQNPTVSCGEEVLLDYVRNPYPNENIMIHEFAHAIHGTGLNRVDPTFDRRLKEAYEKAKERGLWLKTYAATNSQEYWAEGVQCWFDDNAPPDSLHNHVHLRKQLKEYDPTLAKLCNEVFGDRPWKYVKPSLRPANERQHLVGYDPKKLPRFRWKEYPLIDKPVVSIDTSIGEFFVELDHVNAPAATRNFLKIALDGGYSNAKFDKASQDAGNPKNGWIGGVAKTKWLEKEAKEMTLEKMPFGLIKPADGTIAMLSNGTTMGEFVIFVGKPPVVVQNVIPFGTVSKGMDVVRKVHASPATNNLMKEAVDIRRAIRTE